jgi:hypothetical protein
VPVRFRKALSGSDRAGGRVRLQGIFPAHRRFTILAAAQAAP